MGAEVREVDFPEFEDAAAISTTMLMSEASAALRDVLANDGDKLYEPVRFRLEAGLFISAADYLRGAAGPAPPSTAPPAACWTKWTCWPGPRSPSPPPRSCSSGSWRESRKSARWRP